MFYTFLFVIFLVKILLFDKISEIYIIAQESNDRGHKMDNTVNNKILSTLISQKSSIHKLCNILYDNKQHNMYIKVSIIYYSITK